MLTVEQVEQLAAPLSRAHVKHRQQAGRQLAYIEGWLAIAEANRIFGFDCWDREMIDLHLVSEKSCLIGKEQKAGFRVAYIARVRITVHAGENKIVRDGTGYGSGIDVDVGEAHESAVKESETDAMKRALMTFGNPFGLALYDKDQAEVEKAPRPQNAAAKPATQASSRPAGTQANGTRSPSNSGPPATKTAFHSNTAPPFPGDLPSGPTPGEEGMLPDDGPSQSPVLNRAVLASLAEAGREFFHGITGRIVSAKLPSKVDDIIKANSGGLSRLHEDSEPAYVYVMQLANYTKQEMLVGQG